MPEKPNYTTISASHFSSSPDVAINPPARALGKANAILTGTSDSYYVPDFEGCLSIKTVVSGSAVWEANGRRFVVHENSYLILNDRQRYTITIDSTRPVTTFCLFFERGLVEDVYRASTTAAGRLLDSPQSGSPLQLRFLEKLEPNDRKLLGLMRRLREQVLLGKYLMAQP